MQVYTFSPWLLKNQFSKAKILVRARRHQSQFRRVRKDQDLTVGHCRVIQAHGFWV